MLQVDPEKLDSLIDTANQLVKEASLNRRICQQIENQNLLESIYNSSTLANTLLEALQKLQSGDTGEAFIDGFLVRAGTDPFVIPMDRVDECLGYYQVQHKNSGTQSIILRNQELPVIRLKDLFDCNTVSSGKNTDFKVEAEYIVVVRHSETRMGIIVDQLLSEHLTLIKPHSRVFQMPTGISGATILDSGEMAHIVDVPCLFSDMLIQNRPPKRATDVTIQIPPEQLPADYERD